VRGENLILAYEFYISSGRDTDAVLFGGFACAIRIR
jgi:hypothetical protein